MEMAQFGATPRGGCNRQALTDEDKLGRELFIRWCKAVGCAVRVDEIGNIFCRREGAQPELPPVLIGSHLDTQPTGGRFDGVYGVLAGLEVLRTLDENGVETRRAVEVVSWTNEEGARFPPALMGSGVWSGEFDLKDIYRTKDKNGAVVADELERIGFKGKIPATPMPIEAALRSAHRARPDPRAGWPSDRRSHRRSGDSLVRRDHRGGEACHAGPTPMERRRDPFTALAPIIQESYGLATRFAPWSRVTFGDIRAIRDRATRCPKSCSFTSTCAMRTQAFSKKMGALLRQTVARECDARGLASTVDERWHMPVTPIRSGLHRRSVASHPAPRLRRHGNGERCWTRLCLRRQRRPDIDDLRPMRERRFPQRGREREARGPGSRRHVLLHAVMQMAS